MAPAGPAVDTYAVGVVHCRHAATLPQARTFAHPLQSQCSVRRLSRGNQDQERAREAEAGSGIGIGSLWSRMRMLWRILASHADHRSCERGRKQASGGAPNRGSAYLSLVARSGLSGRLPDPLLELQLCQRPRRLPAGRAAPAVLYAVLARTLVHNCTSQVVTRRVWSCNNR